LSSDCSRGLPESGLGLMYQDSAYDKYTFDMRLGLAARPGRASANDMLQAPLRALAAGCGGGGHPVGVWEAYLIGQGNDSYRLQLNRATYRCEVHEKRPVPAVALTANRNESGRYGFSSWRTIGATPLPQGVAKHFFELGPTRDCLSTTPVCNLILQIQT
jgi:hypothetical protein